MESLQINLCMILCFGLIHYCKKVLVDCNEFLVWLSFVRLEPSYFCMTQTSSKYASKTSAMLALNINEVATVV